MNNKEIIQAYLAEKSKLTKKRSFLEYQTAIENLRQYLEEKRIHISDLESDNIIEFFIYLRDGQYSLKPLAVNTCYQRLFLIKSFLIWCFEKGLTNKHPDQVVSKSVKQRLPKQPKKIKKVPSKAFIMKLLLVSPRSHVAMLHVLYNTGLRISELIDLKLDSVDQANKRIYIYQSKKEAGRFAPLTNETLSLIEDYIDNIRPDPKRGHENYLFLSKAGTKVNARTFQRWLERFSEKYGTRITPHTFRAAFATHMFEGGADIYDVKITGGWSSISTLDHYVEVAQKRQKEVMETTHPLGIQERRKEEEIAISNKSKEVIELLNKLKEKLGE